MKIYHKVGKPNYKEAKLINAIKKTIEEKVSKDASYTPTFKTATNFDELKAIHNEVCIDSVEFTEVPKGEETKSSEDAH